MEPSMSENRPAGGRHFKSVLTRAAVAAVLIPVFFLLLQNRVVFLIFIALCIIIGMQEFYNMVIRMGFKPFRVFGIIAGVCLCVTFSNEARDAAVRIGMEKALNYVGLLNTAFLLSVFTMQILKKDFKSAFINIFSTFSGILYVAWLSVFMVLLRQLTFKGEDIGIWAIFMMAIPIWTGDTVAYFAGSKFGRRKLSPAISPGKTVEGAVAGITAVMITTWALRTFLPGAAADLMRPLLSPVHCFIVGMIMAVAGILGDLSESVLKRDAGVKDSGKLLPGHGGLLDRVDAMLFAAPVMYYYLKMIVLS